MARLWVNGWRLVHLAQFKWALRQIMQSGWRRRGNRNFHTKSSLIWQHVLLFPRFLRGFWSTGLFPHVWPPFWEDGLWLYSIRILNKLTVQDSWIQIKPEMKWCGGTILRWKKRLVKLSKPERREMDSAMSRIHGLYLAKKWKRNKRKSHSFKVLPWCKLVEGGFVAHLDIYIIIERIDRRRSVVYPVPYYRS